MFYSYAGTHRITDTAMKAPSEAGEGKTVDLTESNVIPLTAEADQVQPPPPNWQPIHARLLHLYLQLPEQDQREMLALARLKVRLKELQSDDMD